MNKLPLGKKQALFKPPVRNGFSSKKPFPSVRAQTENPSPHSNSCSIGGEETYLRDAINFGKEIATSIRKNPLNRKTGSPEMLLSHHYSGMLSRDTALFDPREWSMFDKGLQLEYQAGLQSHKATLDAYRKCRKIRKGLGTHLFTDSVFPIDKDVKWCINIGTRNSAYDLLESQAGVEKEDNTDLFEWTKMKGILSTAAETLGMSLPTNIMSEVENICFLLCSWKDANSLQQVLGPLGLYLKIHTGNTMLSDSIYQYVKTILSDASLGAKDLPLESGDDIVPSALSISRDWSHRLFEPSLELRKMEISLGEKREEKELSDEYRAYKKEVKVRREKEEKEWKYWTTDEPSLEKQAGVETSEEQEVKPAPDWLNLLRMASSDWCLIRRNQAFRHVSRLVSLMVAVGLCDASKLEFSLGGFQVFEKEAFDKNASAQDVLDAVMNTTIFFAEGAHACFESGSIRPLFLGDTSIIELDREYNNILQWWDLVKNGNLAKFTGMSDHEFDKRLENIVTELRRLQREAKGLEKKILSDQVQKLLKIKIDFQNQRLAGGIREAPFAMEFFGDSAQGKTTLCEQLIDAIMISADLPMGDEYRCVINSKDQYMSNWKTSTLVAIVDDIANSKGAFAVRPPTDIILDLCNNQRAYAVKADLDEKGRSFIEPKIVAVTTNTKDLDARVYSNCPYSVQRRMNFVITVSAKSEYQRFTHDGKRACGIDSKKVIDDVKARNSGNYIPDPVEDIWTVTVEQCVVPERLHECGTYEVTEYRGKRLENVSPREIVPFIIEEYHKWSEQQKTIVEAKKERAKREISKCPVEGCKHLAGYCPDHVQMDKQAGFLSNVGAAVATETVRAIYTERTKKTVDKVWNDFNAASTKSLYDGAKWFGRNCYWEQLVPNSIFRSKLYYDFTMWISREKLEKRYRRYSMLNAAVNMGTSIWACRNLPLLGSVFIVGACMFSWGFTQATLFSALKQRMWRTMRKRQDSLHIVLKSIREKQSSKFAWSAAGVIALAAVFKVIQQWRTVSVVKKDQSVPTKFIGWFRDRLGRDPTQKEIDSYTQVVMEKQGNLIPSSSKDVEERDVQKSQWIKVEPVELPVSKFNLTFTPDQLERRVEKQLFHGRVPMGEDHTMFANVLMLQTNVALIPKHYFDDYGEELRFTMYRQPGVVGKQFRTVLSRNTSYHIPNTDLCVAFTPSGGSFANLIDNFPEGYMPDHPFAMMYRDREGKVSRYTGDASVGPVGVQGLSYYGGHCWDFSTVTFKGLCGSPMISQVKGPTISGIHLAGEKDSNKTAFGSLTKRELRLAVMKLASLNSVLLSGQGGSFSKEVLGVDIVTPDVPHDKSPLNFIPNAGVELTETELSVPQIQYLGRCPGATTFFSGVKETPISSDLAEVCDVTNQWGPPKSRPHYFGWQKAMSVFARPADPFSPDLVQRAVVDYERELLDIVRKHTFWQRMCPLTDTEALCGVPGKRFLDAMALSTSVGFPLTGSKRTHVVILEPTDDYPDLREMTPQFKQEVNRALSLYKQGQRVYFVAKACLKDEILPRDAEKCRVFYGSSFVFTFLIRKYFLPLVRFIQMNPIVAECAVGINAHSDEWTQLHDFMTQFGETRVFAGDYSKYDQRMPAQMILAALRVLLDIAVLCDYSEEDLTVMRAMAGDIVYPVIAYNGDLIALTEGTHISGNSLTVILNSIVGSLNLRCFYFHEYPNDSSFRKYVSMITYGDDNKGSVSRWRSRFNIEAYSKFLDTYGQVYTMPDKKAKLRPYMRDSEAEFLKRKTVYHSELRCSTGALDEDSIFKSLHNYIRTKKSPLTKEVAVATNIDTALREWFHHGEKVYERRRSQMQQVLERHPRISPHAKWPSKSYADAVALWKETYTKDSSPVGSGC